MNIYDRIKTLRLARGLSQYELAQKVGYEGRSAISKVERGERDISQSMIVKYAQALGVTPTYLLYGDEKEKPYDIDDELTEYLEYLKNRPEMRMLFSTLKGATKEDVERAVKIIEALRGDTNG